ncbi:MAG: (2Fe-2S)-binding protein [Maioricimonas sp. JB049]
MPVLRLSLRFTRRTDPLAALRSLIEGPHPVIAPAPKSEDNILCRCLKVTESRVVEAIVRDSASSVRDVQRSCEAGGGCMACHRRIRALLQAACESAGCEAAATACGTASGAA